MPELHDYQEIAKDHLERHNRAGLFMEMGLGKTATVLRALKPHQLPALVTAPKRVAENVWEEETELWRPDLSISVASGEPKARERALRSGADITVIGRDNLMDVVNLKGLPKYKSFIIDESSGFKNRDTTRWKAARVIGRDIPTVWEMTGTPSPNGLLDLWPQLYLLDGGERLGKTLTSYREAYFRAGDRLPNGVVTQWDLREGSEARIHKRIDDICLSMQADGRIKLPPVTMNTLTVPWTPQTRRIYKELKKELIVNLELLGTLGGGVHMAANAAVLSSKLSQVLAGFLYRDQTDPENGPDTPEYDIIHYDKVRAVEEIAEGTGGPLLVYYRYRAEAEMLREKFKDRAFGADTPNLQKRWNNNELPILLAHPASIGHGLNLQKGAGNTIVWTTATWSLEEWKQGNGRLARQGQQNPVTIHVLTTPSSVDTAIRSALDDKATVEGALMDHLESPL